MHFPLQRRPRLRRWPVSSLLPQARHPLGKLPCALRCAGSESCGAGAWPPFITACSSSLNLISSFLLCFPARHCNLCFSAPYGLHQSVRENHTLLFLPGVSLWWLLYNELSTSAELCFNTIWWFWPCYPFATNLPICLGMSRGVALWDQTSHYCPLIICSCRVMHRHFESHAAAQLNTHTQKRKGTLKPKKGKRPVAWANTDTQLWTSHYSTPHIH